MNRKRQRNPNLAFVIALISILSVINSFLAFIISDEEPRNVIILVTEFLSVFFILSFLYRFTIAPSKIRYLAKEHGWLDLLACLPFIQISWLFRGARAYLTLRQVTFRKIREDVRMEGAEFALFIAIFVVIVIIEASSIFVLFFEGQAANANIVTAQDALWWVYVTIATVGYGDLVPVTTGGRLVGIVLMTTGVGIFATIAGYFAHRLLYQRPSGDIDRDGVRRDEGGRRAFEKKLEDIAGRQEEMLGRLEQIEALLGQKDGGDEKDDARHGKPRP